VGEETLPYTVTVQLADTPTRGLLTSGLDDSRTGHLADWSTRALVNSRTGQVADSTTRGCYRRLCVLSFRFLAASARPRVVQSATCPVREMSSPRVGSPRVGVSASCPVTPYTRLAPSWPSATHRLRVHPTFDLATLL